MPTLPTNTSGIPINTALVFEEYPTYTYYVDPITRQLRGFTDGLQAMQQAIEIHLSIERYRHQIFSPNIGFEKEGLVGRPYAYNVSEIKRRVEDAFVPDARILGTSNWVFSQDDYNSMSAKFTVHTVYGPIEDVGVVIE